MDSWEEDADISSKVPVKVNKWDGEDEDDDIKDSWDQEPEEEKEESDALKSAQVAKKSKKIGEKFDEKEKKRRELILRRHREEEEKGEELTAEQKHAEKLLRQKLQEESDLELAKEVFGDHDEKDKKNILDTVEEFEQFKEEIMRSLRDSTKSINFAQFVDQLVQSLCVHLNSTDLKKLHIWIGNLHIEKGKLEKGEKTKKKGKGKAKLRLEGDQDFNEFSAYTTEDYDDFI